MMVKEGEERTRRTGRGEERRRGKDWKNWKGRGEEERKGLEEREGERRRGMKTEKHSKINHTNSTLI